MRPIQLLSANSTTGMLRMLPEVFGNPRASDAIIVNTRRRQDVSAFINAVRETTGLATDFDGTAIGGIQWEGLRSIMSQEMCDDDKAEVEAYFQGHRSDEGDKNFLLRSVQRLAASGLTQETLRSMAAQQVPRSGTGVLFGSYAGGLNVAVVSYGIEAYIAEWSMAHRISVGAIYAARLQWASVEGGYAVTGCDPDSVVIEATKGAAREQFASLRAIEPKKTLVLEDTPKMLVRMMDPKNVGILVLPRNDPHANRAEERMRQLRTATMFEEMDAVLVSDSLWPLADLRAGEMN